MESSSIRSASMKDMSSFRLKKKNHDDLNNTRSGNYGFVKHKNHENARKQRERTLSVRTLGPCGAATAKKKNLLRPSSFLLRRSPSNVRIAKRHAATQASHWSL